MLGLRYLDAGSEVRLHLSKLHVEQSQSKCSLVRDLFGEMLYDTVAFLST